MNQKCLACDDGEDTWEWESMVHLAECEVIRNKLWLPLIELMSNTKLTIPEDENDLTLFILLGIIDDKVCDREAAAILALAWRSLYAEIINKM